MSDAQLRGLQRIAVNNPDDNQSLWRYVRALERQVGFASKDDAPPTLQQHLETALAASGFRSLDDIRTIKTIPEIRRLVAHLFPWGEVVGFTTEEWNSENEALIIRTAIASYRDSPPELQKFLKGHGTLWQENKYGESTWLAPFRPAHPEWVDTLPPFPHGSSHEVMVAWQVDYQKAWEAQEIVYDRTGYEEETDND